MFPAPAGMSPFTTQNPTPEYHVPRTRGDEPFVDDVSSHLSECSPHPRG